MMLKISILSILIPFQVLAEGSISLPIQVFAGDDTSICSESLLSIDELEATITGDVSDGMWFTLGDGRFLPGNVTKLKYSEAITYVPGPEDISEGRFTLMLVSDDPDDDGPLVEVTDMVSISFQNSVALVCNTSLNLSLGSDCVEEVTPEMILVNPSTPIDRYTISLRDHLGRIIQDNILTEEHVGKIIQVWASHDCAPGSSCEGEIYVKDSSPPRIYCSTDTVACTADVSPDSIGFPVLGDVTLIQIEDQKYLADGLDGCGSAELWYSDEVVSYTCESIIDRKINRTWSARDEYDNFISCIQEIYLRKDSLSGVVLPPHRDGVDGPLLECSDAFKMTNMGYPHPDVTGFPDVNTCSNIEASYTDHPFELCGESYKVLRKWFLIDWCTSQTLDYNQIIKVADTLAPEITCPSDVTIATSRDICMVENYQIPAIEFIDCSDASISYELRDTTGYVIVKTDDSIIPIVPFGKSILLHIVTDVCGNADTCYQQLEVIDKIEPTAICETHTVVSLGIDGTARLFASSLDDGSHDNCDIEKMEVVKMDPVCSENQTRGSYVDFCCVEAGSEVMVSFIVTDINGNENTCMVSVQVQDKLPPMITCPTDLTISCRTPIDFNDLDRFGKIAMTLDEREEIVIDDFFNRENSGLDGLVEDNCYVKIESTYTADFQCKTGTIIRTFTAIDSGGFTDQCQQVITVKDEDPIGYDDITWPLNYTENLCADTTISDEITGRPSSDNDGCADMAYSYVDQSFPFAENSCMKILRKWTAIDWCTFERNSDGGVFNYTQIIKLNNIIAPTINCQDTVLCNYEAECGPTNFVYEIDALDDCTGREELDYQWVIKSGENLIATGTSKIIREDLLNGKYIVDIQVEDRCGNISDCSFVLDVKDCKKPNTFCISSVTTVLMEQSEQVAIWARDFNFKSSDNCTPEHLLQFSFSRDVQDTSRIFTCDSIVNGISQEFEIEMWVTDLAGNQENCVVRVVVQDNVDTCPDNLNTNRVTGTIIHETGVPIDDIEVNITPTISDLSVQTFTDEDGGYLLELPATYDGNILPRDDAFHDEGVNTLDIVKIQRHILGKSPFTSPFQLLAADVNGSGRLTASDILAIRKVILKKKRNFSDNLGSWKFIAQNVGITMENALDIVEGRSTSEISIPNGKADFIGVKLGDVDNSWSNAIDRNIKTRSTDQVSLKEEINQYLWSLSQDHNIQGMGFQLEIALPEGNRLIDVTSELIDFGPENYNQVGNMLYISYHTSEYFSAGELIKLEFQDEINKKPVLSNLDLQPQWYEEDKAYTIAIEKDIELKKPRLSILGNIIDKRATIKASGFEGLAIVDLIDQNGRLIMSYKLDGEGELILDGSKFPYPGTYFVNLKYQDYSITRKLIKLN